MRTTILLVILALLSAASARAADTLLLKNGDKLTGTFVNEHDGKVNFKADVVGAVAVPFAQVQSFAPSMPVVIVTTGNTLVRGMGTLAGTGDWTVSPLGGPSVGPAAAAAGGAPQIVPAAQVKMVLPQDTYHKLAEIPMKPWQGWSGSANAGYSLQHGDQTSNTISGVLAATRERSSDVLFVPHLRSTFGLNLLFSKASQDGAEINSNTISADLREDYLFSPRDFVFGIGQVDHVDAQGLYLQQTYGGGFGRDLIHTSRVLLSAIGGVTYVHEHYDTIPGVSSVDILVGQTLGAQLTSKIRLDEHFNFYPDLSQLGQYRFDTAANVAFKVSTHLTANAGLINLYLSKVAPGNHNNNIALTTGLGYAF